METNQNLLSTELQIDSTGHTYLFETAKWASFLGIMGFIFSGLFVIISLFAGTMLGNANPYGNSNAFIGAGFITVLYLIIAVINFFLSLYLYRFASKMKLALNATDQDSLNNSFLNLKNLYKLMGILVIVYLVLILLAMVFGIGAAIMR